MNAIIMTEIPKTFCPAKWDETILNLSYNYVWSCCKAKPEIFADGNYEAVLDKQKNNLLNDIQDPSCEYCWKSENNNLSSKRHEYLKFFDQEQFVYYKNKQKKATMIELYIGNECNFQCTYCNPKFSSKWEYDVKDKPYKIFTAKDFYGIDIKQQELANKENFSIALNLDKTASLRLLGGEPLVNKNFWKILEVTNVATISLTTNLSCKSFKELDKLIEYAGRFELMYIGVSLDATNEIAEFTRYGLDFKLFDKNLEYLLKNKPANMTVRVLSLMTSVTIRDLANTVQYIVDKKRINSELKWEMFPCIDPRIHSFETLPENDKRKALSTIEQIKVLNIADRINVVESSLLSSKFNKTLYNELLHFLKEFANRKNINIPICLS
jgi:MoaA/NifB/PqqE/SkfB family radical SAM enzyme